MISTNIFKGKNVIVTGHTGFKGSWLTEWLKHLGSNVFGIGLAPHTEPSHFNAANISSGITDLRIDIRNYKELEKTVISIQPDFVFHLAAQALVNESYENPMDTWQTNVIGTVHVLETLKKINKKCVAVMITSDKCYENVEWVWGYRETDKLGGIDPYSASKSAAEIAINSFINSFFPKETSLVRIASVRAGNVIGGGDWSIDRIIPDCVKAWSSNNALELRNPYSTRPWQHVLEPLSGYLALAALLLDKKELHGESFNFGPHSQKNHSVLELVEQMALYWEKVRWSHSKIAQTNFYESGLLKLNCDKALYYLNWHAAMNFEETVKLTAEWYKSYYENPKNIASVTKAQIINYTKIATRQNIQWTQ